MPDREFIHTSADVVDVLKYASDSQFQIIDDTPQAERRPKTVLPRDIPKPKTGRFISFDQNGCMAPSKRWSFHKVTIVENTLFNRA